METHRYLLIALSMQDSQVHLAQTKVSRETRQVPYLTLSFGFGFFNHKGVSWLNETVCQILPTCPGEVVGAGRTLVFSCREVPIPLSLSVAMAL